MDAAVVLVVGGFVTASAGLVFDTQREKHRVANLRDTLSRDMGSDLARAIAAYDGVALQWQEYQTIDAAGLRELGLSVSTFLDNQEWLGVFDECGLSRAIFKYFEDCIELQRRLVENRDMWTTSRIMIAKGEAPCELVKADIELTMRHVTKLCSEAIDLQQQLTELLLDRVA